MQRHHHSPGPISRKLSAGLLFATLATVVSAAPRVGAAEYFALQVVDSSPDVGYAASLALDSLGRPHIAYYDQTNDDLKYASWDGAGWTIETADGAGALSVGTHASLVLDSADRPHISYYDQTNDNLKYCRKNAGVWTTETVDAAEAPSGWFTSIALDAAGNPRISYQDQTAGDLRYAARNGGIWSRESVDIGGSVGWYSALALDSGGNPRISYFDFTNQDLKYAARSGLGWTVETVDAPDCKGSYTSLALKNNNPVIAYYDCTNANLRLAEKVGGLWTLSNVDTAGDVGEQTSVRIAADGQPRISYQHQPVNGFGGGLKYAWRSSGGQWTTASIDTAAHYALFTSLRLDSRDVPHIAYQKFGGNEAPPVDSWLKYAHVEFASGVPDERTPVAGLLRVAPNPVVVAAHVSLTLERNVDRLKVRVFDVTGRLVAVLHDDPAPAGPFDILWNGRGTDGERVPSGLYFVRATGPGVDGRAQVVVIR